MRLVLVVLAVIGLIAVLDGVLGSALAGLGLLLLVPVILFKLFLIMMIIGFIGRKAWGWDGHRHRSSGRRGETSRSSSEDRFESWHRMAHAREEVDSWGPEVPGTQPE